MSIRLPESLHARIAQAVEDKNKRAIKAGFRSSETVVTMTRDALDAWAMTLPPLRTNGVHAAKLPSEGSVPSIELESEADDAPGSANGHRVSDETTLRPALHGRRVGRKIYGVAAEGAAAVRPGYVPSGPVPTVEGSTGSDEPTAEELAAILEGTPGL